MTSPLNRMSFLRRNHGHFSSPHSRIQVLVLMPQNWKRALGSAAEPADACGNEAASLECCRGEFNPLKWKTLNSRSMGIKKFAIQSSVWTVLRVLREKGHEAYLVGGCVRDLLLGRIPKDFDVVTTASLKQIGKHFYHSIKVGRRFPIRRVCIKDFWIEVSSFETTPINDKSTKPIPGAESECNNVDLVRWRNTICRDFTINSLLYDPSIDTIYDYVNAFEDLKARKVRTVIPAHLSFKEDCARILRGIRIAARLCLTVSEETRSALVEFSSSIYSLSKARLLMEMDFMLAYGAAAPSICLLQRFKALEIVLPFHAAYLCQQAGNKIGEDTTMLLRLFSSMDKLLAADRPSDCSLWLSLLAFHVALVEHPQDSLTLLTFSSILCQDKLNTSIAYARENAKDCVKFSPEISDFSESRSDELLVQGVTYFASLVKSSLDILTNSDSLTKSMGRYQSSSSFSDLVFVSKNMSRSVNKILDALDSARTLKYAERMEFEINYDLLKKGDVNETRFVLGKVIRDALIQRIKVENVQGICPGNRGRHWTNKGFEQERHHVIARKEIVSEKKIKQVAHKVTSKFNEEKNHVSSAVEQDQVTSISNKRKARRQMTERFGYNQNEVILEKNKEKNQMNAGVKKVQTVIIPDEKIEHYCIHNGIKQELRKATSGYQKKRKATSVKNTAQNNSSGGENLDKSENSVLSAHNTKEGVLTTCDVKEERNTRLSGKGKELGVKFHVAGKRCFTLSKLFRQ